jgi:O-6-methylguanine DNA methyltransferase
MVFAQSSTGVKKMLVLFAFSSPIRRETKVNRLIKDISRYLDGQLVSLSMDLMDTSVCYPLQHKVLMAERTIPRGKTVSYSWLARKIDTTGVRAVASASARNPFSLVVPCHRVVRLDGGLGGFQGGLEMKRALLEMEGVEFDSKGRVLSDFIMKNSHEIEPVRTGLHFSETSWLL